MGNKLYVGNLDSQITAEDLALLFSGAGRVLSAQIITDRETKRSKGFAFVEMADEEEALRAVALYHGHALGENALIVNEARPAASGTSPSAYRRAEAPKASPSAKFREVKHKRRGGADRHRFH